MNNKLIIIRLNGATREHTFHHHPRSSQRYILNGGRPQMEWLLIVSKILLNEVLFASGYDCADYPYSPEKEGNRQILIVHSSPCITNRFSVIKLSIHMRASLLACRKSQIVIYFVFYHQQYPRRGFLNPTIRRR